VGGVGRIYRWEFPPSSLPTSSGDKRCAGASRKWFDEASREAFKASEGVLLFKAGIPSTVERIGGKQQVFVVISPNSSLTYQYAIEYRDNNAYIG